MNDYLTIIKNLSSSIGMTEGYCLVDGPQVVQDLQGFLQNEWLDIVFHHSYLKGAMYLGKIAQGTANVGDQAFKLAAPNSRKRNIFTFAKNNIPPSLCALQVVNSVFQAHYLAALTPSTGLWTTVGLGFLSEFIDKKLATKGLIPESEVYFFVKDVLIHSPVVVVAGVNIFIMNFGLLTALFTVSSIAQVTHKRASGKIYADMVKHSILMNMNGLLSNNKHSQLVSTYKNRYNLHNTKYPDNDDIFERGLSVLYFQAYLGDCLQRKDYEEILRITTLIRNSSGKNQLFSRTDVMTSSKDVWHFAPQNIPVLEVSHELYSRGEAIIHKNAHLNQNDLRHLSQIAELIYLLRSGEVAHNLLYITSVHTKNFLAASLHLLKNVAKVQACTKTNTIDEQAKRYLAQHSIQQKPSQYSQYLLQLEDNKINILMLLIWDYVFTERNYSVEKDEKLFMQSAYIILHSEDQNLLDFAWNILASRALANPAASANLQWDKLQDVIHCYNNNKPDALQGSLHGLMEMFNELIVTGKIDHHLFNLLYNEEIKLISKNITSLNLEDAAYEHADAITCYKRGLVSLILFLITDNSSSDTLQHYKYLDVAVKYGVAPNLPRLYKAAVNFDSQLVDGLLSTYEFVRWTHSQAFDLLKSILKFHRDTRTFEIFSELLIEQKNITLLEDVRPSVNQRVEDLVTITPQKFSERLELLTRTIHKANPLISKKRDEQITRDKQVTRAQRLVAHLIVINTILKSQRLELRKNDQLCIISKTMAASREKKILNVFGLIGNYTQVLIFSEGEGEEYKITGTKGEAIFTDQTKHEPGYGTLEITKQREPNGLVNNKFIFKPDRGTRFHITIDYKIKINLLVETQNRITLLSEIIAKNNGLIDELTKLLGIIPDRFNLELAKEMGALQTQYDHICTQIVALKVCDHLPELPEDPASAEIVNATPNKAFVELTQTNPIGLGKFLDIILDESFDIVNDLTAQQINQLLELIKTDPMMPKVLEKFKLNSEQDYRNRFINFLDYANFLEKLEAISQQSTDPNIQLIISTVIQKSVICINHEGVLNVKDARSIQQHRTSEKFHYIISIYSKFLPRKQFNDDIDRVVRDILYYTNDLRSELGEMHFHSPLYQYVEHNLIRALKSKQSNSLHYKVRYAVPSDLRQNSKIKKLLEDKCEIDPEVLDYRFKYLLSND